MIRQSKKTVMLLLAVWYGALAMAVIPAIKSA
jgi:hypothetical protein